MSINKFEIFVLAKTLVERRDFHFPQRQPHALQSGFFQKTRFFLANPETKYLLVIMNNFCVHQQPVF